LIKVVKSLRRFNYDLVINLYPIGTFIGSVKMGLLFSLLKAKLKVGHNKDAFGLFVHKKLPDHLCQSLHRADAMVEMARLAGGEPDDGILTLCWDKAVEARVNDILGTLQEEKKLVGINPGGDRQNRRWNPFNFSKVANRLGEKLQAGIIILGGPGEEQIAHLVETKLNTSFSNLCGKLSLDELIYLISRLDLLVSNDSGPMHIAAATRTPVVALFGPENPDHFKPYTQPELYRIIQKDVSCRPCADSYCTQPVCLESINPEEVVNICRELIGPTVTL
jgi:lipopolysaccharide heptosyltransferase II